MHTAGNWMGANEQLGRSTPELSSYSGKHKPLCMLSCATALCAGHILDHLKLKPSELLYIMHITKVFIEEKLKLLKRNSHNKETAVP